MIEKRRKRELVLESSSITDFVEVFEYIRHELIVIDLKP